MSEVLPDHELTPAVQEQIEAAKERETKKVENAQTVFDLLKVGKNAEDEAVARELEVGGQTLIFFVKRFSYADCSRLDAKRHRRKPNGGLEFNTEYAETVGMAWQIHEGIVRNANEGKIGEDGQPLAADWVRVFTMEQILGKGGKGGLMNDPKPETKEFIYGLAQLIWNENPELSPLAQANAAASLGMM